MKGLIKMVVRMDGFGALHVNFHGGFMEDQFGHEWMSEGDEVVSGKFCPLIAIYTPTNNY